MTPKSSWPRRGLRPDLSDCTSWRAYVDAGGLMSYGSNLAASHRRAAYFVDSILKGAKPGDLPVEQPTKFERCRPSRGWGPPAEARP